ncbi:alpha-ketoglutarate-dependent dioxygenase AlkB [Pseudonocardia aurantiaca]|uniref:Alpha-ketoglutarate-dependent dioxygenase AlkB n=1 Tax=Pseudonocardia aurantiaca TaxID=75290 RepID=A0ABW4FKT0_9PSEU
MAMDLAWQPSLLDAPAVEIDTSFRGLRRDELADGAWVDLAPGWCRGADDLFARLLAETPWSGRDVRMYDRVVREPRLTHRWRLDDGPAPPAELREMAAALSYRYGVEFTQIGANLYRDGADSVAWHGDRVARELPEAVVALVSLGAPRPFRLRPTGGGASVGYVPGPGDLLVMGGSCQRTWQHAVPKMRVAPPRMSVQFRHAYMR